MTDKTDLSDIMMDAAEATIENEVATESAAPRPRNIWLTLVLPIGAFTVLILGFYYFVLWQA
ncbi:hypothetical protein [Acidomonas methanolica]|uniref:hypothetical protein n=1 Tax=Acidomonas methanolica TaxID=437 RepID=UPI002119C89B|nr:hypothetical protein [Acidomonas methanolica]MCQ9155855.1 hypothetical protein [Acidomonas methanolica]